MHSIHTATLSAAQGHYYLDGLSLISAGEMVKLHTLDYITIYRQTEKEGNSRGLTGA